MYLHAFVKYLIMGNKSLCSLFPQQIGINTEVNPGNSFIFKSLQILGYLPKWVNSTQRSRRPKATPVRGSPLGDLELNFPESVRPALPVTRCVTCSSVCSPIRGGK